MSAADAREQLEAAFWRNWPVHRNDFKRKSDRAIAEVLAAADIYAEAVADERIAGRVRERAAGRERLAEAAAEAARRAS